MTTVMLLKVKVMEWQKSNQITFIVTSPSEISEVSEILESMLQTVQKQFTYRQ